MAKNNFTTLMLLFCVPALTWAQTFTNDEYGYSIEVDDSFQLTRNNNATYFRSKDSDRIVIIKNWPGLDADTARDYLQQGYQDEHIALVPVSEPEEINAENGKGLLIDIQGVIERKLMKGVAGSYIGNDGQGIVLVVAGSSEDWDKLASMAQEITASIKFIDGVRGPDARDWYNMLTGARLSLRGASNDKSRREDLDLCSDGGFLHRMSTSALNESDSGSVFGFSAKTRSGSWEIIDDAGKSRLLLHYSNGREESAIIEDRNGQAFLDDQRFYMTRNNRCR